MQKCKPTLRWLGMGVFAAMIAQTHASGYHFGVQSVSGQGVANAGTAAAQDASTLFYNPASIVYLPGSHITAATILVSPHVKASNLHSVTAASVPVTGGGIGSSPTSPIVVPQLYMTHQVTDRLFAGLGVFVPFGDVTQYDNNWNGRYNGVDLDMKSVAFNPQLAYKLDETFSVGLGVSAQYINAKFQKNADFGTVIALKLQQAGAPLSMYGPYGAGNGDYDGNLEYKGHDWGFGWNIGAMWQVDPTLRVGAAYRSRITQTLSGDANWSVPSAIAQPIANAGYVSSQGKVNLKTPDSFSLNFYKTMSPQLALMGDWTYTRHSAFQELRLDFSNNLPDAVIEQKWKNTQRYSLGATYRLSDPLLLRFGLAYDQSPVPSNDLRIASLPDSDRMWYSIGTNYALTKQLSVDVAYTYVKMKDTSMSNLECSSAQGCTGSGTLTKADFATYVHLFGAQVNYRF